jgi:ankyrin repeat protein
MPVLQCENEYSPIYLLDRDAIPLPSNQSESNLMILYVSARPTIVLCFVVCLWNGSTASQFASQHMEIYDCVRTEEANLPRSVRKEIFC